MASEKDHLNQKQGVVSQASGHNVIGFGKGRMGADTPGTDNSGKVMTSGCKMPNNAENQRAGKAGGK